MAKELETLLIQSKTRDLVKDLEKGEVRISEDFLVAFNAKIHGALRASIARAKLEGVATLKDRHV